AGRRHDDGRQPSRPRSSNTAVSTKPTTVPASSAAVAASASAPSPKPTRAISNGTVNPTLVTVPSPRRIRPRGRSSAEDTYRLGSNVIPAHTPAGLPTTRARSTPTNTSAAPDAERSKCLRSTPALASAKSGKTTRLTAGFSRCSHALGPERCASVVGSGDARPTSPTTTPTTAASTPPRANVHQAAAPNANATNPIGARIFRTKAMTTRQATPATTNARSTVALYTTTSTRIERMSSATPSVMRKTRKRSDAPDATRASAPREKAMSVAIGMPQTCPPARSWTTAAYTTAG